MELNGYDPKKLGDIRPCDPACEAAQAWAKALQEFLSTHYCTCTPQILAGLAAKQIKTASFGKREAFYAVRGFKRTDEANLQHFYSYCAMITTQEVSR